MTRRAWISPRFRVPSVSPYVAVGGGYTFYEQSTTRIDGQPIPAPRKIHRGAFDFGGGVDVAVWR